MIFPKLVYITAHPDSLVTFETLAEAKRQAATWGTKKFYRLVEVENPVAPRPAPPHPPPSPPRGA